MLASVVEQLERWGLLLESDKTLPSVVSLVAGGPVKGSWWGHPKGHDIFRVSKQLMAYEDALLCKLLSGKLTFVHRRHWPALVTVGAEGAEWQLDRLPRGSERALLQIEAERSVLADDLRTPKDPYDRKKAVEALVGRLLVYSYTVHTDSGAHARMLESWDTCVARKKISRRKRSVAKSRDELEAATDALNKEYSAKATLPWQVPIKPNRAQPRRRQ